MVNNSFVTNSNVKLVRPCKQDMYQFLCKQRNGNFGIAAGIKLSCWGKGQKDSILMYLERGCWKTLTGVMLLQHIASVLRKPSTRVEVFFRLVPSLSHPACDTPRSFVAHSFLCINRVLVQMCKLGSYCDCTSAITSWFGVDKLCLNSVLQSQFLNVRTDSNV